MTDIERWKAFLGDFNVRYTEETGLRPIGFGHGASEVPVQELEISGDVSLLAVLVEFDMAGRFISIGGA